MKWYIFIQNNSSGVFLPPAKVVFVEASSVHEASRRLLFGGYVSLDYCECCGERWAFIADEEDATFVSKPPELAQFEDIEKTAAMLPHGSPFFYPCKKEQNGKEIL